MLTFKSVFMNNEGTSDRIEVLMAEQGITGSITSRESRENRFISYTVTAEFKSEDILNELCTRISDLQGFIMLF